MNQRLAYLDLASGIMIVWLLCFHALMPMMRGDILLNVPIFYFFMPWFFFKSGMMFEYRDCKALAKKDCNKLLKAFAVWSLIGYIAHIIWHWLFYKDLTLRVAFYSPTRSFLLGSSIPMNTALWFIPILFCIRQLFNRGGGM